MSLVANYSDSDSETGDDSEPVKTNAVDHISDEEEYHHTKGSAAEDYFEEEADQDVFSIISQLPIAKVKATEATFVDEKEDVSAIPEKKDYGDKIEEPPAKKKKKKREGPVRLVLPALEKLEDSDPERSVRVEPSKTGSGLFALLPAPKRGGILSRKPPGSTASEPSKVPALSANPNENNLKPQGVRKVGLVPHRVANPVKAAEKKENSDDSDDDGDYLNVQSSYFPSSNSVAGRTGGGMSSMMTINPVPSDNIPASEYEDHEPHLLGPAVAPYPPPAPSYPEQREFVESEDALRRLAGKQNKLKEDSDEMKIIDVHEDQMRGDPRDWMTKAMTEEKAPRPSGKGPKGLARSRHQITYLAHQAKERDWELRQDWATSRENRKASANKYGF